MIDRLEGYTSVGDFGEDLVGGAGLHLSMREMQNTLGGVGETVLLYPDGGKGRLRTQRILTDTDPTQQQLADLFNIDRYAPAR